MGWCGLGARRARCQKAGFGVDVGEEGAGDLGEEGVEVSGDRLRQGAGADGDFGDGAVARGGLAEGPEEGVVLSGGGGALRASGEALGHAQGEGDVDGEREARASAEEGAGDGIEDCGVDQAFARAKVVVRRGEVVVASGGLREGADGFGAKRLGFGAEQKAGWAWFSWASL